MRISGGKARGVTLVVPKGDAVRPATDGLRQAVFSSLAGRVEGSWFLDLFAGSGSYGLEALSRGALGGVWVERHAKTVQCLRRNLEAVCKSLGREPAVDVTIVQGDAVTAPWSATTPPDLVFVDPPYPIIHEAGPRVLQRLGELLRPHPDPVVVFEMPGDLSLEVRGWKEVRRLGKGAHQPTVVLFKRDGEAR
jgi:16S rRNA (guanine966-N2)-methyltransferase